MSPGMLERMFLITKVMQVAFPCLWEDITDPEEAGGAQLSVGVGVGMVNSGPDPLVVHDRQVVGQWEAVKSLEEQSTAQTGPPEAGREAPGKLTAEKRKKKVWEQLAQVLEDHLRVDEREEALQTLGGYVEVFNLLGEPTGLTDRVAHIIDVGPFGAHPAEAEEITHSPPKPGGGGTGTNVSGESN